MVGLVVTATLALTAILNQLMRQLSDMEVQMNRRVPCRACSVPSCGGPGRAQRWACRAEGLNLIWGQGTVGVCSAPECTGAGSHQ